MTTSYKIEDKVITTVTDNGSNVVKAFSLPGYHDDPFHQERYKDEEEDDEEREIDAIDLHDSLEYVSEHDTCFAHTLQLVIKDGFKEIRAVRTILGKVATIVSHVRRSQSATEILEGERRLQAKNATQWNSELRSIKSILRVSEDKLRLLDTAHLTAHERKILEDLVEILSPFQEATDFTQGANIVTSSFVIPCIRGLKKSLETLSVTFNSRMVTALTDSLQIRMTKYESRELFMLASTLDPRFKLKWCIGDDEQEKVKSILLQKAHCSQDISMDVTTTQEQEVPQPQVVEIATTSSEPLSKKRKQEPSKLLSYLFSDEDNLPPASTISNSLEAEISMYISEPCLPEQGDPLAFWKEHSTIYPKMSKLACHYLSIPASSGPVERLFSIGGKFFRPERCRLSDSVFEKLMNIKCNGHLV